MEKLNPQSASASASASWTRHASAFAGHAVDEEDEAFLRPVAPLRKPTRGARAAGEPELVPNYDPHESAEAFLRTRRRVSPRKGGRLRALLQTRLGRILLGVAVVLALVAAGMCLWAIRSFLQHDPHFRIDSSASIEATGNAELSRSELVQVFGSDIGRNIFFVPIAAREAALEAMPWVSHATVMRLLPKTLRVAVVERVPIAFARVGRQIELVDAAGVLLSMAPATLAARHYSFPVVTGLAPDSPAQARAERMHLFESFIAALDAGAGAGGGKVSSQLSEVDLSDLDDVRAVVPAQGTDILLHFGNSDFLERYRSFQEHLPEWRQQYPHLSAVDLRYDRQVVLKMADAAALDQAEETRQMGGAASKPARAALPGGQKAIAPVKNPVPGARHGAGPAPAHGTGVAHTGAAHIGAAHTWYTVASTGAHHTAHWIAHYIPNAGKAR